MVDQSQEPIVLPDTPLIPGLRFRPFRGEADYPAMVAVHQSRKEHDAIAAVSTMEFIPTVETIADNYRGFTTLLFAEVDGQVIGYNTVTWWTDKDTTQVYLHLEWLMPRWREQGIELAMLHWVERYLREVAVGAPAGGSRVFGANATSAEREQTVLLRREGYQPAFTMLQMTLDNAHALPQAPLPAGVEVRPATPGHYRALWKAQQDAYGGEFVEEGTEDDYREFAANPRNDPSLWRVAWDGDRVAGQVRATIYDNLADIDEVDVAPSWRRRGLARALLVRSIEAVRARGVETITLRTMAENPTGAPDLYRSLGFHVLKEHVRYRKPM